MPTIYIHNKPYEVKAGKNLLEAALSLGFDLPYFCWHPALGSVGACRQCAVKLFKDEHAFSDGRPTWIATRVSSRVMKAGW